MTLGQHVPVHPPLLRLPVTGLRGRLGLFVDAHGTCLQLNGGARKNGGGERNAGLGAVEDALGDGGECAVQAYISSRAQGEISGAEDLRGSFVEVSAVVGLVVCRRTLRGLQRLFVGGLLAFDDRGALVAAAGELGGS